MLADALAESEPEWRFLENITVNKIHNRELRQHLNYVLSVFTVHTEQSSVRGEGEQDTRKASPAAGQSLSEGPSAKFQEPPLHNRGDQRPSVLDAVEAIGA
jgi:hypothetical protein